MQHDLPLRYQAHSVGQRRAGAHQLIDRKVLDQLRPQQQRVATLLEHLVDKRLYRTKLRRPIATVVDRIRGNCFGPLGGERRDRFGECRRAGG